MSARTRQLGSMEVPARVPPTARFIEQNENDLLLG